MAGILPVAFYSGNKAHRPTDAEIQTNLQFHQKLRKIDHKSKHFSERPLLAIGKESFFAPHRIWETFATQSQALDYQKHCKKSIESRIFVVSEELSTDGKRRFVVSSFEEFWRRYTALSKEKRHFYEVIPEGHFCRLYFDLEFYKNENPDLNGTDTLEVFIDLVCFYLIKKFGICCNRGNVIDLDSSTKEKFSRHLIFHIPNVVFCSNVECGNFVRYIYEMARRKLLRNKDIELDCMKSFEFDLEDEIHPPDRADIGKLFVNNKDGKKTFFADLGVYTKNRNFRLYGSSKVGKDTHLVISDENGFHGSYHQKRRLKNEKFDSQYLTFLDTLVCHYGKVTSDLNILTFANPHCGSRTSYTRQKEDMQCKVEEGYRLSPYPKLDEFMLTQVNKGGIQGTIRRWMHFVNSSMMLYDIGKNHFCENIGRAHKSNHIYFIVDIRCGIFYQKCHDPDCIDFKSEEKVLPEGINPVLNNSDFLIDDFDDDSPGALCDAVEIAECGESFIDNELNDDKLFHSTDMHDLEDFCADSLIWEDFNDDWELDFIKEHDEKWIGENVDTNDCKSTPSFVGDHLDVKSNQKNNSILKANHLNSKRECNEAVDSGKETDVYTHANCEALYADMHVGTSKICGNMSCSESLIDDLNCKAGMESLEYLASEETSLSECCETGGPDCQQTCIHDDIVAGNCNQKSQTSNKEVGIHENEFCWKCESCKNCGKGYKEKINQCSCRQVGSITVEESSCLQRGSKTNVLETTPDIDSFSFDHVSYGQIKKNPNILPLLKSGVVKVPQVTKKGQGMSTRNLLKTKGSTSSKDFSQVDLMESVAFEESDMVSSGVLSSQNLSCKNRKDRNEIIDKSSELIDYNIKENKLPTSSPERCHQERVCTSYSCGDSSFDTSSMRCELSDFYLDSDLDDELMNLDWTISFK